MGDQLELGLLQQLKANYAIVKDPLYGECLLIPSVDTRQFDPDWTEKLKQEGCKIFQGSASGRAAFFVRLPGQPQSESAGPRTVYEPPAKPPTPPTAAEKRPFLGKSWTLEEDKEVIKGVTLGQTNEKIAERLPGRTAVAIGLRVNRLRKHGALPKTKRGKRRKPIREGPKSEERPLSTPTPIRTTLTLNLNVDCSDARAVDAAILVLREARRI